MSIEQQVGGASRVPATDDAGAGIASLVEGLAAVAGAFAVLPAVRSASLADIERCRVSAVLGDGWNLAAFTPTGALVLEVVDAAGARIEVAGGMSGAWGRARAGEGRGVEGDASSHGAVRAAWGAPPGRRVAAMGMLPAPGGGLVRASCGLVLRLPAAAIDAPLRVAAMLSFHAAMYAAERRSLPADGHLAITLDRLELELGVPRGPKGRVAWADRVVDRVVEELGGIEGPVGE